MNLYLNSLTLLLLFMQQTFIAVTSEARPASQVIPMFSPLRHQRNKRANILGIFNKRRVFSKESLLNPYDLPSLSFWWEASLDSETGIASSLETSSLPCPKIKASVDEKKKWKIKKRVQRMDISNIASFLFREYPVWLCRKKTSFGLLRAIMKESGSISVQDVFTNTDLLVFGAMVMENNSEPNQDRLDNFGCESARIKCQFPIVGGVLSLGPSEQEKNRLGAVNAPEPRIERTDRGCVQFELTIRDKNKLNYFQQIMNHQKKQKIEEAHGNYLSKFSSSSLSSSCMMKSAVLNYRPMIAGSDIPVSFGRKYAYLSSQRLVHAFVMRRFHGYCYLKMVSHMANDDANS